MQILTTTASRKELSETKYKLTTTFIITTMKTEVDFEKIFYIKGIYDPKKQYTYEPKTITVTSVGILNFNKVCMGYNAKRYDTAPSDLPE